MKRYEVVIGSPTNYKELVAYIVIDETYFALVSQDEGIDKLQIEFFEEVMVKNISYDIFLEALQEAKMELLK